MTMTPASSKTTALKTWGLSLHWAVAALAAAFALLAAPSAKADPAAEAYVQKLADEVFTILNADATDAEKRQGLRNFIDRNVDTRRIGRFTLGPYARQISRETFNEFATLFKQYATAVYEAQLENYSGERLVVFDSLDRSARDVIVRSRIAGNPDYNDLVVNWRVLRVDSGFAIVDVGAQDIWLSVEQRSQFTSIVANNGGGERGVRALINELKAQLTRS